MKRIKTFFNVDMPHYLETPLTYLRVYLNTALVIVFIVGVMFIWEWATGYKLEITKIISPIGEVK